MKPRTLELTPMQQTELEQLRDHDRRPYLRECAAALLKIAAGDTAHHVAYHGLHRPRDPDTVYTWLDKYDQGGLAALVHRPRGHRGLSPPSSRSRWYGRCGRILRCMSLPAAAGAGAICRRRCPPWRTIP